ncbi:MAG: hypothetical protein KDJ36_13990, partial [Hyphomicrobiaceae bacterium]|nr:hypothetical protein [Hyphomicrobiaceae bacterium]
MLRNWMERGDLSVLILEAAAAFADPSLCQALNHHRHSAAERELHPQWQEAWESCNCATSPA